VGRLAERLLFEEDELLVVPQRRSITVDQPLASEQEQHVVPHEVVEHFIRASPHRWRMDRCICREASGCQHYPLDLGCLFLGAATRDIHPKLGQPLSCEEALAHARRCRDAGLVHLIGRNKLDTVWLSVGPGYQLLTICSCCPCCCLWRILPDVHPRIAARVHRMPGVRVQTTDRCVGCGYCTTDVCFVDAIELSADRARITEACRGCGRCVAACPNDAIELRIEDPQYVAKAIERIAAVVDVE
jgi:ferredoxin